METNFHHRYCIIKLYFEVKSFFLKGLIKKNQEVGQKTGLSFVRNGEILNLALIELRYPGIIKFILMKYANIILSKQNIIVRLVQFWGHV